MSAIINIGKLCPNCGSDNWIIVDNKTEYDEICNTCAYINVYVKQDFVSKFECPDCRSLAGTLEENDYKLGVRCNNCNKLHIMLEKQTTVNNRNKKLIEKNNQKRCPKCGNTEFTPLRKKFSLLTGFATNKTELICNKCGARVK